MGKTKKTKKDVVVPEDNSMDSDTDIMNIETDKTIGESVKSEKLKKDKKKSGKKAATKEDSGDENELRNVKTTGTTAKRKGKKKSKNESDDDDDNGGNKISKPGFSILMDDSQDDDDDDVNDNEKIQSDNNDDDETIAHESKNTKSNKNKKTANTAADNTNKKGKKARRKRDDSDEDIAKVLAELEMEYSGQKKQVAVNITDESNKNTQIQQSTVDPEPVDEADVAVKTAAQKKKEKKERQKRDAALLAQQANQVAINNNNNINDPGVVETTTENVVKKKNQSKKPKEPVKSESISVEGNEEAGAEQREHQDSIKEEKKSKKKSKPEKKDEEKDKTKKKGISSAMMAAMQERLNKVKEEEERLKREEEIRIQREEELENMRLEKIRLEIERKERKKQREQERKARLKAEGKLLTTKQKQDKARAHAMIESLRAQGVDLPEVGEKRPRPGTRVRPNKKKDLQQSTSQEDADGEIKTMTDDGGKSAADDMATNGADKIAVPVDVVKDEWDASNSDDGDSDQLETESSPTNVVEDCEESAGEESDDDNDDADDEGEEQSNNKKEEAWERILKRRNAAEQKRTVNNLRAAVVCVLGHVDTGKTKILDKLRRTNVQDCEAGGITQQIGATNVPIDAIKDQTRIVKECIDTVFKLPGLLIIDTPGHESFSNLRSRGSSLCDIAILVVDIMHGLEPQTIESINLLKAKKTPFVVALNKIDRLYNWDTMIRKDVRDILKNQAQHTQLEFQQRTKEVVAQFSEQGLNAALFYDNPDPRTYVNLVPTSAITGEGMGNLLYLIVDLCQSWLAKRLMYSEELLATVLEVKAISGLGTTIDAILINGRLREGETMIIAGTDGPIVTQIRSLLMPQPMKELRVKNAYIEHKEIIAAQGVKIAAKDLEKAIAGLNIYIANKPDEIDICKDQVAKELKSALSHIKLKSEGVYVQASTLGSLEALLEFLRTSKIPYSNIRIGPVVKRDVMKASTMLEHESQYATILAFDVKIERDAQDLADSLGVKIFQADIIYHLFDQFTAYRDELREKKREEYKSIAVFPCKLKILPHCIFNTRDPIVIGVMVEGGIVKPGTPICVPSKEFLDIGIVSSVEINKKPIESARKGQEVCLKIEPIPGESPKLYGRHFDDKDLLMSKISRQSIDACKDYFRDDLLKADWALMVELKKLFQIL